MSSCDVLSGSVEDLHGAGGDGAPGDGQVLRGELGAGFGLEGGALAGDVVELVGERRIRIIGRRKQFFKLAGAEFVYPDLLERHFMTCDLVRAVLVTGLPTAQSVVAVVVPAGDGIGAERLAWLDLSEDQRKAVDGILDRERRVQCEMGPAMLKAPYSAPFPHFAYTTYGYVNYFMAYALYPEIW